VSEHATSLGRVRYQSCACGLVRILLESEIVKDRVPPASKAVQASLDYVRDYGVDDRAMRSSELAKKAAVNAETLRYYERRGLLHVPPRSPAGYRDYPPAAVGVLRFIKRAQKLGLTLDQIDELLHLDSGGPDNCDAARVLAENHKVDLEQRIRDLRRMRDSLAELIATCELPRADRRCALLDALASSGSGAHDEA